MTETKPKFSFKTFWRERVVGLILGQLKQGITAKKVALTISLGVTLGLFPILGTTTTLCVLAGICFKLNQPILQLANYLVAALQLLLIVVFVRIGEWVARAPRVNFSVPEMMRKFKASPRDFMHEFWLTGLHGIEGWLVVAPFLVVGLYFGLLPALSRLAGWQKAQR